MLRTTIYGGIHGYNSKELAKEVAERYGKKAYKGRRLFSSTKVIKKKMPYGETRYFIKAKWR